MKNRRGIHHQSSDKTPVSFCDVVDGFSEEEWKLLQLWQKELYNNLMKELQQAFRSLGPLIATSVFSLKPKVKEDACFGKHQDLNTMNNVNLYSGDTTSESDMIFEENEYLKCSPKACESGRFDVPNTGDDLLNPGNIVRMEGGLEPDFMRQYDGEKGEGRRDQTIGTTDMAAAVSFSIKSEEEMYSDSEKSESISYTTRHEVTAPVASIGINEVGEIYPIDLQADLRGESSNSHLAGKGNMNRKRIISYNDKLRTCKTPSKKLKPNVQRVNQKKNVIPLWPGNDHELELENKTQPQSGFHRHADYTLQNTMPNIQLLEEYDNCESLMKTGNNVPCEKNTMENFEPHTSSGSDQSYRKDCSNGQKQARKSKVRYHCTECGKTCLWMSSLIMHQRIHTGERPFHCTICGKRFTQKGDLRRHQQVHTGARPYKCNVCNKTFTQKWHLHKHERSHVIIKMY